ncbi:DUF5685 family protein [Clostridium sp. SYSU_GA19001]|uniref:DUF5685 family protein n=1 Tax=Clostridium caldaquaticum TaxID=2940653 RepID=UPI002076D88A|nr:DUF5685 family protein [Clostridium caldaquaticum]MCM8711088.1 DUF5685 family protein [Clostridium caldaquaticum]
MFGYVTPCKMELKIKDFEKFKAYYCGLCREIKKSFGNVPRLALNYDMAFLAVLLDSLEDSRNKLTKVFCCFHPTEKRLVFIENSALKYAAFCNVILTYYKLLDNINDDNSKLSKIYSSILNIYLKKAPEHYRLNSAFIEQCLSRLYSAEKSASGKTLDELSHHFADLTGLILSSYNIKHENSKALYWLGYNLGKWIYIIDAYDDLKKDMEKKKFNAINAAFNSENLTYSDFVNSYSSRIDFILTSCAQSCLEYLNNISVKKNYDLLHNILQFGLMEKMDKVFKRDLGGIVNEKSL